MVARFVIASLIATAALASPPGANTLELEGFYGGMPLADFMTHRGDFRDLGESTGPLHRRVLVFGGVEFGRPTFVKEFSNPTTVGAIRFAFDSQLFAKTVAALKDRYPDTTCKEPTEKQGVVCKFENADGEIMVTEHGTDARSSYYLLSTEARNTARALYQQAKAVDAAAAVSASAEHIYLKEFRLGFTAKQFSQLKYQYSGTTNILTFGGAAIVVLPASPDATGLVNRLAFLFVPPAVDAIKAAILTKYPKTRCENSVVGNAMGAKFDQVVCTYRTDTETLLLTKYADDLQSGTLVLVSNAIVDKAATQRETAKTDL